MFCFTIQTSLEFTRQPPWSQRNWVILLPQPPKYVLGSQASPPRPAKFLQFLTWMCTSCFFLTVKQNLQESIDLDSAPALSQGRFIHVNLGANWVSVLHSSPGQLVHAVSCSQLKYSSYLVWGFCPQTLPDHIAALEFLDSVLVLRGIQFFIRLFLSPLLKLAYIFVFLTPLTAGRWFFSFLKN